LASTWVRIASSVQSRSDGLLLPNAPPAETARWKRRVPRARLPIYAQASTNWEGRDRTYNLRFQGPPRCHLRHSPTHQGERPDLNRRHPDSQTGASTDWATLTMLPPRFELGSRADQALAGYKPAAFPVKLRERIITARVSERLFRKSAPTGTRTRTLRRSGADTSSSCRSP
jgi:hypothetical protein